ncbi:patatin-like phospholipase family protein [Alkalibacter mobilis]|uniref:patatin-like phospholipase family protein n=1 Tax=Alkalibacter mobilis TaxID=2787712 RepID=UPI00189C62BF|nr:patatin-like phospholipase family protein [Alkalibacter mobilis]MBF7095525.1 patatin-like phospholipase family protein [Alkalibacter mobilis]
MLGIVLEGGGAKGAYQIGAWKAIRELGIEYAGVVGTSVGSLNGAMMVQDDFDRAYDLWNNMKPEKVIADDDLLMEKLKSYEFRSEDPRGIRLELEEQFGSGGFDITPFKRLIAENIDEEKIRKSNKDFGLVTIDLETNTGLELFKEDIPKGQLGGFLLASSYLPVFKEESIFGKRYLDGGYFNNLPTRMLVSKGYKDILIIKLNGREDQFPVDEKSLNVTRILPSSDLGDTLDFSNEGIKRNLKLGYMDTMTSLSVL